MQQAKLAINPVIIENVLFKQLASGNTILEHALKHVQTVCTEHKIGLDHGYEHALQTANYAQMSFVDFPNMSLRDKQIVILASLFHDLDDAKLIRCTMSPYHNLRRFTHVHCPELHAPVELCIDKVSFSKNGNTVEPGIDPIYYIPRDADRISCGGVDGIVRTVLYSKNLPTPRPVIRSMHELVPTVKELRDRCQRNERDRVGLNQSSIFQFYMTNWFKRRVIVSGSGQLKKIADAEYDVVEKWLVAYSERFRIDITPGMYNYNEAVEIARHL